MKNFPKAMVAGLVATIVLSLFFVMKDAMGIMPQLDLPKMIAGMMGMPDAPMAGWAVHFFIGVVVYGATLALLDEHLPGDSKDGTWCAPRDRRLVDDGGSDADGERRSLRTQPRDLHADHDVDAASDFRGYPWRLLRPRARATNERLFAHLRTARESRRRRRLRLRSHIVCWTDAASWESRVAIKRRNFYATEL